MKTFVTLKNLALMWVWNIVWLPGVLHWPDSCHAVHVQSHSQTIDCCTVCCTVVWEWDYFACSLIPKPSTATLYITWWSGNEATSQAVSFPDHWLLHCHTVVSGLGIRLLHKQQHSHPHVSHRSFIARLLHSGHRHQLNHPHSMCAVGRRWQWGIPYLTFIGSTYSRLFVVRS